MANRLDEPRPSHVELLTRQFSDWEIRGRGWQLWPYPVELEPPYKPFLYHYVGVRSPTDDAQKPTFLSTLGKRFTSYFTASQPENPPSPSFEPEGKPTPEPFVNDAEMIEIAISLPPGQIIGRDAAEQFMLSAQLVHGPFGFELIATRETIRMQLSCRTPDVSRIREQLHAYFPAAVLREESGYLESCWDIEGNKETALIDFGLSREFMMPLRTYRSFDVDPLIGVLGAMSELKEGELAVLQVLAQGTAASWTESILRAVTDGLGNAFFADAPEMVSLAQKKVASPLFATVIRLAVQSPEVGRAWQIAETIGASFAQFTDPSGNEFIPLTNDGYPDELHGEDILRRQSHRSGMLLNADELVSLVHLPSASVRAEKLTREIRKTKAVPDVAIGHSMAIGQNIHSGKIATVSLSTQQRLRHTYVIGASGTGKSTLLLNMILQDIERGNGIAVLDPHGDLIDRILGHIPENRADDVVLIDPSDEEYPVGFNILSAHSEIEKTLLSSDLVSVFRRLSTTWGDQMTSVLGNAILAFLESNRGGTLADLRRFLVEPEYREEFLRTVGDPDVVYYWHQEFPLLAGRPQAPLLTRLDTFLRPKLIRYMVSQKKDRLDFRAMMDGKKIVLAKLAQGAIGEENAYLLGTLIVAKLHQMALGRQNVGEADREPFYVYIDEFHNFITPSIAAILSGARKFGLGLILSHQELNQISNQDTAVASAAISNPFTRVCFRLGDSDAAKLQNGFSSFDAKDLQSLSIGEAIVRVERAEYDFNLKTMSLPQIDADTASANRERVVSLSRQKYARRRNDVAGELAKTRGVLTPNRLKEARGKQAGATRSLELTLNGNGQSDVQRQPKPGAAVPVSGTNGNGSNGNH